MSDTDKLHFVGVEKETLGNVVTRREQGSTTAGCAIVAARNVEPCYLAAHGRDNVTATVDALK
mgnify:FL=1